VFLFGAFHVELAVALVLNFLEYSAWYLEWQQYLTSQSVPHET
jgi:hypothetical protein